MKPVRFTICSAVCAVPLILFSQLRLACSLHGEGKLLSFRTSYFMVNVGQWPNRVLAVAQLPEYDVHITEGGIEVSVLNEHSERIGFLARGAGHWQLSHTTVDCLTVMSHGKNGSIEIPVTSTLRVGDSTGIIHLMISDGKLLVKQTSNDVTTTSSWRNALESAHGLTKAHGPLSCNLDELGRLSLMFDDAKGESTQEIVSSRYIGSVGHDKATALANAPDGNIYVTGYCSSLPVFDSGSGGRSTNIIGYSAEGFIARLNQAMDTVLSWTFLGGSSHDTIVDIVVDNYGDVFVTGNTLSADFPITPGAAGQRFLGGTDAFVTKLSADLRVIHWSTYISGNGTDLAAAIDVDPLSHAYVCGSTNSTEGFPTVNNFRKNLSGGFDAWAVKLSPGGANYVFATYIGGAGNDRFVDIAVRSDGQSVCVGTTSSPDFQTWPQPDQWGYWGANDRPFSREFFGGNTDAVVVCFNPHGGDPLFSTFFGGSGNDEATGVGYHPLGTFFFCGNTTSIDLPGVSGYQLTHAGQQDGFLILFQQKGIAPVAGTYFGGEGSDEIKSLRVYGPNRVLMGGVTTSKFLPVQGTSSNNLSAGETDIFFTLMNTQSIEYLTKVSWSRADTLQDAILNVNGDICIAGVAWSPDLDRSGAFGYNDGGDAFTARFVPAMIELTSPTAGYRVCGGIPFSINWRAQGFRTGEQFDVYLEALDGQLVESVASGIDVGPAIWTPQPHLVVGDAAYYMVVRSYRGVFDKKYFTVQHPGGVTINTARKEWCEGQTVVLTCRATGDTSLIRWMHNGVVIGTSTTAIISDIAQAHAGTYYVVSGEPCALSVPLASITLSITAPPMVVKHPISQELVPGESLRISVQAIGGNLMYQWFKDDVALAGFNANTEQYYKPVAGTTDTGMYHCMIWNECDTVHSDAVWVSNRTASSDADWQPRPRGVSCRYGDRWINVTFHRDQHIRAITAYNLLGQRIALTWNTGWQMSADISQSFAAGTCLNAQLPPNITGIVVIVIEGTELMTSTFFAH